MPRLIRAVTRHPGPPCPRTAFLLAIRARLREMADIRVGVVGRIKAGEHAGKYVKIKDDAANTGGFLIIVSPRNDFSEGFDDWVEGRAMLEQYFAEAGWSVDWES